MKRIVVQIGAGELLDRLSIMEIKVRHVSADAQRRLRLELDDLCSRAAEAGLLTTQFEPELSELRAINEALWRIEDELRGWEARGEFGHRFIDLSRSVYKKNDQRSRIKRQIDERYGSVVWEEKIYSGQVSS